MSCYDCVIHAVSLVCEHCGRVAFNASVRRNCSASDCSSHPGAITATIAAAGPGTELHALLGRFGLTASGDCKCTSRAAYMDRMEAEQPGWCEANIDEIVGWLRESAAERGLPFLDVAARLLVKRAIANARRKAAADAQRPPHHDRREEVAPPVHQTEG